MLYGNVTSKGGPTCTVSKAEDVKSEVKTEEVDSKVIKSVGEIETKEVNVNLEKSTQELKESKSIELPHGVILNINVNFNK